MAFEASLKKGILILCALVLLGAAAPASARDRVQVFVTIMPQKYFVEKIGGDLVNVSVLVMPGANPHMYEPSPRQMTSLSMAKAYFAIGISLEDVWLSRFSFSNVSLRIFHTEQGVTKIPMAEHHHDAGEAEDRRDEVGHAEGHGHDDHGILDPHIWLDPVRARTIARNICAGMVGVDPANRAVYEANLAVLLREIDETNDFIASRLASVPEGKRTFMVFHPSWGYFADRYGLTQVAIEAQGNEPGPRHLAEIIEHGRELGISVVFVQPQFSQKSASVIASELGASVIPLDPLAEDWNGNLRHAAEAFGKALK
jgi:zinc transport system substrate-binding protein